MSRVVEWIQEAATALGGPGLALIAFLDSSFLSFPQVVDLLVVMLVTKHKQRVIFYPLFATVGSIAGCFVLYFFARRGGDTFLRRRMKQGHVDRALTLFQKYGLFGVLVPSLLPPPIPFKVFVVAAGVANVRPVEFLIAVAVGRSIRYFGEAALAFWYGERAAAFLKTHSREASLVIAGLVVIAGVVMILRKRRRNSDLGAQN
jgi:membrane protein YqaA with SNARE-associated domain